MPGTSASTFMAVQPGAVRCHKSAIAWAYGETFYAYGGNGPQTHETHPEAIGCVGVGGATRTISPRGAPTSEFPLAA